MGSGRLVSVCEKEGAQLAVRLARLHRHVDVVAVGDGSAFDLVDFRSRCVLFRSALNTDFAAEASLLGIAIRLAPAIAIEQRRECNAEQRLVPSVAFV